MAGSEDMTPRYTVSAVERTFRIIEELARTKHGLGLAELTGRLDLPKSTVFGILVTLKWMGYVDHEPEKDRYRLGLRLYSVAAQYASGLDLVQVSTPLLQRLVDGLGETANLGVLKDGKIIYLASIEGSGPLRVVVQPGQRSDVHCTAMGKVLLADLPGDEVRRILSEQGMARRTSRTSTDPAGLEAELNRVRIQGYGVDDEEEEEAVRCLAAPVRDQSGAIVASISIAGPAHRLPPNRWSELAGQVARTAECISVQLGYLGDSGWKGGGAA